ncbi:MAG: TIGR03915 family putative DNA repair protein [Spirochaetaceae bacterium]|jgi:probable DNA metabolism protein|nr:TIGR03915 family putative DNA repair protein [Spirochaetaceae bacterium]
MLSGDERITAEAPRIPFIQRERGCQQELFDETGAEGDRGADYDPPSAADLAILAVSYPAAGAAELSGVPESVRRFFELSVNAFDALVHAWMSEFPVEAEIIRFGRKVLRAAETAGQKAPAGQWEEAERQAAERVAAGRGDLDTQTVLNASRKVWHEIHRLMGFLRFSPEADSQRGLYIARCAPDHFILPALREYFTRRFGNTPWIIIDEKRRLCVGRADRGPPRFFGLDEVAEAAVMPGFAAVDWGKLWRHYHKTINNESRNNPRLQRQFMPERYRKYLTEL